MHATKARAQYSLNLIKFKNEYIANLVSIYSNLRVNEKTLKLWHRRCEHFNRQNLLRLESMTINMNLSQKAKKQNSLCDFCKADKMKRKLFRRRQDSMFEKNKCIDFDLISLFSSTIYDEFCYRFSFLMSIKSIELNFTNDL